MVILLTGAWANEKGGRIDDPLPLELFFYRMATSCRFGPVETIVMGILILSSIKLT